MKKRQPSEYATAKAAQAWCEPETSHLTMEPALARVFALMLDAERGECAECDDEDEPEDEPQDCCEPAPEPQRVDRAARADRVQRAHELNERRRLFRRTVQQVVNELGLDEELGVPDYALASYLVLNLSNLALVQKRVANFVERQQPEENPHEVFYAKFRKVFDEVSLLHPLCVDVTNLHRGPNGCGDRVDAMAAVVRALVGRIAVLEDERRV